MYVGLSVSSGWFDIHRYPISFDVIKHIFIGVYGLFVFYGMEIHFWKYHSYDNFYPHFLHFILFGYLCVYVLRCALIVYIFIDLCSVVFCFYCWNHWFVLCLFFDLSILVIFLSLLVSSSYSLLMFAAFSVVCCVFILLICMRLFMRIS